MSNPFAVDQGKPCFFTFSWRFRAVMSTAKAWRQELKTARKKTEGVGKRMKMQLAYWLIFCSNYMNVRENNVLYPAI